MFEAIRLIAAYVYAGEINVMPADVYSGNDEGNAYRHLFEEVGDDEGAYWKLLEGIANKVNGILKGLNVGTEINKDWLNAVFELEEE